jgi:hypothetical protein
MWLGVVDLGGPVANIANPRNVDVAIGCFRPTDESWMDGAAHDEGFKTLPALDDFDPVAVEVEDDGVDHADT